MSQKISFITPILVFSPIEDYKVHGKYLHDSAKPIMNKFMRLYSTYYTKDNHKYCYALGDCTRTLKIKSTSLSYQKKDIDYTFFTKGLKKLINVQKLRLNFEYNTQYNIIDFVAPSLKNFRELVHFELNISLIFPMKLETSSCFARVIRYLHQLRTLKLSIHSFQEEYPAIITKFIQEIFELEYLEELSLNLKGTDMTLECLRKLLSLSYSLKRLKSFEIYLIRFEPWESDTEITPSDFLFENRTLSDFKLKVLDANLSFNQVTQELIPILSGLKNLKRITLGLIFGSYYEEVSEESYTAIFQALLNSKMIELIDISFGDYDKELSESLETLAQVIETSASSLKILKLECNSLFQDESLSKLQEIVKRLSLEEYFLNFFDMNEIQFAELIKNASSSKQLKSIAMNLSYHQVNKLPVAFLEKILPNIETFSLDAISFDSEENDVLTFMKMIKNLNNVKKLTLSMAIKTFTKTISEEIMESLKSLFMIQELSISFAPIQIDSSIVSLLSRHIRNMKTLRALELSFEINFNLNFADILEMIEDLPHLSILKLRYPKFMQDDGHKIALKKFFTYKNIKVVNIGSKCLHECDMHQNIEKLYD